jgi:hypothetical protein
MTLRAKLWSGLVALIYAGAMGYATWTGFTAPYQNWDMLGYVGNVTSWQTKNAADVYPATLKIMKENVSDGLYNDIISNPLSNNARAFTEQLPFYRVKPLYTGAIWLLNQTGLPLPNATWVVSATCFGLLSIVLFLWRPRYMAQEAWLLLIVALTYLLEWPMRSLACFSTPDALATLLVTGAFYAWWTRHSFRLFFILGWLAELARPDAMIVCGALAGYFTLLSPHKLRMPVQGAALFLALLVITQITVSHFAGSYGWERLFIYSFLDKAPYPAEATDHLTPARYWGVISANFLLYGGEARTLSIALFSLLALCSYYLRPAEGNRLWLHLLLIIWGCITVRFLLFPAWGDDRYSFGYYLFILFAGGELISAYTAVLWKMLQEHRKRIAFIP